MKGIIFNIAESFILSISDEDTLEEIMEHCDLETSDPFVAPGTYPDTDFIEIVKNASRRFKLSIDEFLRQFGQFTFGKLADRYSNFVEPYNHPKAFLKTVDAVIHVEVRKLYDGTQLPSFQYQEPSENELIITYYSKRKLYALMGGLIEGVADYFGTSIKQRTRIYSKEDEEYCDFHLTFGDD